MLSFPIESVRAVIARGRANAEANDGFRNPHYGLHPGRDEQPSVWLVGDHGVYLCSNGKLPDGEKPFVVYALECDPRTSDAWFEVKHWTFGGDDGAKFIDAAQLEAMIAAPPQCPASWPQFSAGLDGAIHHRVVVTSRLGLRAGRDAAAVPQSAPAATLGRGGPCLRPAPIATH